MGMGGELRRLAEFLMTLNARCACLSDAREHVIWIALVAGVAGKTRKFSAFKARRLHNAIEFASTDADHPIRPKKIAQDFGIAREILGQARNVVGSGSENDRSRFLQVITRTIFKTVMPPILGFIDPLHGMTKAAKLC